VPVQVTISAATVRRAFTVLVVAGILALAAVGVVQLLVRDPFGGKVDPTRWQAVFLSNDRVYFGHLRRGGGQFYELREAFFLQQGAAGEGEQAKPTQQVRPITEELQGPEQRMLIRRETVVLVENLRPDSPVVQAIKRVRTVQAGRSPAP
jgi:hypothetical protein